MLWPLKGWLRGRAACSSVSLAATLVARVLVYSLSMDSMDGAAARPGWLATRGQDLGGKETVKGSCCCCGGCNECAVLGRSVLVPGQGVTVEVYLGRSASWVSA